MSEYIYVFIGI